MPSLPTSSLSVVEDINEFVQEEGNGVKGLADMGIEQLPKQYIHPEEKRLNMENVVNKEGLQHYIPVIDMLSNFELEEQVCEAAKTWGFFQVINHGIPLEVMEEVKAAAYRFFESPVEEKRVYLKGNSPSEFVKYGTSFVPDFERSLEWKDYLSFTYVSDEEAATVWPISCRDETLKFLKSADNVISRVFDILVRGLKIDELDESRKASLIATRMINMNYYPKCPDAELAVGVGAHSDVTTLTVLIQDDVGGLYARGVDGESWVNIPPIQGALIFNIGDAFQILSNGAYKSAEHRVVANGSNSRVSVPIFVTPSLHETTISPFPEIIMKQGQTPLYKELLYLDYYKHFFANAHDGKATIEFAKA